MKWNIRIVLGLSIIAVTAITLTLATDINHSAILVGNVGACVIWTVGMVWLGLKKGKIEWRCKGIF